MSKASKLAAYQKTAGESDPVQMLRRLELSVDQMAPIVALAHEYGIHAIVTVFSAELVREAERLPWNAYKTASPDIINKPLLDSLAATGRPLIMSTGASTLQEVGRALAWLRPIAHRLAVLQCVSAYPTPKGQEGCGGIGAIRDIFPGPVGYSDHTTASEAEIAAVVLGATILEKHMTYSTRASGPDHAASLTPRGMRTYVQSARLTHEHVRDSGNYTALLAVAGPGELDRVIQARRMRQEHYDSIRGAHEAAKAVLAIEQDVRTVSRQSLVTTHALSPGHRISRADLTIKRPGTGIPPFELDATLGRVTSRPVEADMPLMPDDVA